MIDNTTLMLVTVLLPVLVGLFLFCFCKDDKTRDYLHITTAIVTFVNVVIVASNIYEFGKIRLELFEVFPGLKLVLMPDPLGLFFALIVSGLWIFASLYSVAYMRDNNEQNKHRFTFFFMLSISMALCIAFAGNLLTLFLFYEALTLATYPLVTHKGNEDAIEGGRTYLKILLGTSIGFFLPAIIWVNVVTGSLDFKPGGIISGDFSGTELSVLYVLFMYGIGKAALMPFHKWLPSAMVAPTPVSALLHAVAVVKAGVFCVVKVVLLVLGPANLAKYMDWNLIFYVSGLTIVLASSVALGSDNLKRRLAYSTISQLAYVVFATSMLSVVSITAAIMHILAHAAGKISLFFTAGSIYTVTKKTNVSQMHGVGRSMPITMAVFTIGALSMIGVPLTAGFMSKWYLLQGSFALQSGFAIFVMIISTLLNAAYFLPIVYKAYFEKDSKKPEATFNEASPMMLVAFCCTGVLTIALFFLPMVTEFIHDFVRAVYR